MIAVASLNARVVHRSTYQLGRVDAVRHEGTTVLVTIRHDNGLRSTMTLAGFSVDYAEIPDNVVTLACWQRPVSVPAPAGGSAA